MFSLKQQTFFQMDGALGNCHQSDLRREIKDQVFVFFRRHVIASADEQMKGLDDPGDDSGGKAHIFRRLFVDKQFFNAHTAAQSKALARRNLVLRKHKHCEIIRRDKTICRT